MAWIKTISDEEATGTVGFDAFPLANRDWRALPCGLF